MDFSQITVGDIAHTCMVYIGHIDTAQKALEQALDEEAHAEHNYRQARAQAWGELKARTGDAKLVATEKEDWINGHTAELRLLRDAAVGKSKAAQEQVRNRRAQLTGLQSVSNAIKAEAELARTAPGT